MIKPALLMPLALLPLCLPSLAQDNPARVPLPYVTASGEATDEVKPDIAVLTFNVVMGRSLATDAVAEAAKAATAMIAVLK